MWNLFVQHFGDSTNNKVYDKIIYIILYVYNNMLCDVCLYIYIYTYIVLFRNIYLIKTI